MIWTLSESTDANIETPMCTYTQKDNRIISIVSMLVALVIECNRALKMASFTSKATTY
jgi:hypothetical protein